MERPAARAHAGHEHAVVLQLRRGGHERLRRAHDLVAEEEVQRAGVEQALVVDHLAAGESQRASSRIEASHRAVVADAPGQPIRQAAEDLARAPARGEGKGAVGAPAHFVAPENDVLEHALQIHHADALAHPGGVHARGVDGPNLKIVRPQKHLGDALAEGCVDPLTEIPRCALGQMAGQKAPHAAPFGLRRQMADVVLEGIGHPGPAGADPGLALMAQLAVPQQVVEHPVEILVVREHHVAANVPGVAALVLEAGGQAAGVGVPLEHGEGLASQLGQAASRAQPRGTSADDGEIDLHETSPATLLRAGTRSHPASPTFLPVVTQPSQCTAI